MTDKLARTSQSEFILYQSEDGRTTINVRLDDETVWLTQAAMAELFQTCVTDLRAQCQHSFTKHLS